VKIKEQLYKKKYIIQKNLLQNTVSIWHMKGFTTNTVIAGLN